MLAIVAVVIAVVANRPEKKKPSSEKPKDDRKNRKVPKKKEQKQEDTDTKDPEDQTNGTVDEPVSEPTETDYISRTVDNRTDKRRGSRTYKRGIAYC